MTHISIDEDVDEAASKAINLALISAEKISKRAGIAWVLLDENRKHLHSESIIAGTNSQRLAVSISRFRFDVCYLVLTIEPIAMLFNQQSLIDALERSSCKTIIIGDTLKAALPHDLWDTWIRKWQGNVQRIGYSRASRALAAGPYKVSIDNRPWVTSVSAASMTGNTVFLDELVHEFGFSAYIDEIAKQSRAVLYSTSQRKYIDHISEVNYVDEYQEFFEVDCVQSISAIFRHCAREHRCSILMLVDIELQSTLMESGMTDEVLHHISFANDTSNESVAHNRALHNSSNIAALPTKGWQQVENSIVGNSNRLKLMSSDDKGVDTPSVSGCRLN